LSAERRANGTGAVAPLGRACPEADDIAWKDLDPLEESPDLFEIYE
jgi:hypothetical protein